MRILLAFSLCAFAVGAGAQMYRWTDAQGRVHITDTPPPASAKSAAKKTGASAGTPSYSPEAAPSSQPRSTGQEPFAIQQAKAKYPVTLYTIPSCEGCDAARNLLNTRGVPFKEISLIDAATTNEFKKTVGADALPTMLVGSLQQTGFEPATYNRLLDDAGYPAAGIVPPRNQSAPTAAAAPASKAGTPQAKPAAQGEQAEQPALGPYSPGAPPPPPPVKKK